VSAAKSAAARLTGEGLYNATIHWFGQREAAELHRWPPLAALAKADKWNGQTFANGIEAEMSDTRMAKVDLPISSTVYESLRFLRSVTHDRVHAYELTVQGLLKNDDKMAREAVEALKAVNDRVSERAAAVSGKP
jgi:hypothetical protein